MLPLEDSVIAVLWSYCVISDNNTQFTLAEFKDFCNAFPEKDVTTPLYHPRSNGQAERFVGTLKRALKKTQGTPTDRALQQFLQVYRITLNPNTPSTSSPAEIIFSKKISSAFDKLIPKQFKINTTEHCYKKAISPRTEDFFKNFQKNMPYWEERTIGEMLYIIQGQKHTH